MVGVGKIRLAVASTGALVVAALATGAGQPQGNPDYGFVVSKVTPSFIWGDEKVDCPQGRSPTVRDAFLLSQPPAERARLLKPENSIELEKRYKVDYVYGAGGKDICTAAPAFDTPERPMQKTTQSKVAPGLDLDGAADDATAAPGTCAHQSFTGLNGERGVDNQYFRAIACNTFWRGAGTEPGPNQTAPDGVRESQILGVATVMMVRGVQDWRNDPQVQVVLAASPDEAPKDVQQKIVGGGSLSMSHEAKWRFVMNGRIQDGVLTTDPVDIALPRLWAGAIKGEFIMKRARLRLVPQPNGDLAGQLGGYRPIDNIIGIYMVGGPGVASTSGLDCASVRKTLRMMADGDPDPKSGACTTVSMSIDFVVKPAFLFDGGVLVATPGKGVRTAER